MTEDELAAEKRRIVEAMREALAATDPGAQARYFELAAKLAELIAERETDKGAT